MPYEMVDFVNKNTQLKAIMRVGGDLNLLRQLLAAGYPVLVEKGLDHDKTWMGHYQTLTGYDDSKQIFIAQDSFIIPDMPVTYSLMTRDWRVFDNLYILIYPPDHENQIQDILGSRWDETTSYQMAKQMMSDAIPQLKGRDQAFAYFSLGTSDVGLRNYKEAADAFDKYFSIYSTIAKEQRPWRMMWYQNGPYEAYYQTGRYHDIISLASITLGALSEKLLEEACYWRGMAKIATGDLPGAMRDLQEAVQRNPNYLPAIEELQKMNATASPTP